MISYELVSIQSPTNSSSRLQYSVVLTKKVPPICVLPPPQVRMKKTFIYSPQQPHQEVKKKKKIFSDSKISLCKSTEPITTYKMTSPTKSESIALKFPQHRVATTKRVQAKQEDNIKRVKCTRMANAQEQFTFRRKNMQYNMPRDSTYQLIIFENTSLPPFDI